MDELTTKDVLGMVMDLSRDLGAKMDRLGTQLTATQTKLERYDELRGQLDGVSAQLAAIGTRVEAIEEQAKGKSAVERAIREWGAALIALIALAKSFIWR